MITHRSVWGYYYYLSIYRGLDKYIGTVLSHGHVLYKIHDLSSHHKSCLFLSFCRHLKRTLQKYSLSINEEYIYILFKKHHEYGELSTYLALLYTCKIWLSLCVRHIDLQVILPEYYDRVFLGIAPCNLRGHHSSRSMSHWICI